MASLGIGSEGGLIPQKGPVVYRPRPHCPTLSLLVTVVLRGFPNPKWSKMCIFQRPFKLWTRIRPSFFWGSIRKIWGRWVNPETPGPCVLGRFGYLDWFETATKRAVACDGESCQVIFPSWWDPISATYMAPWLLGGSLGAEDGEVVEMLIENHRNGNSQKKTGDLESD